MRNKEVKGSKSSDMALTQVISFCDTQQNQPFKSDPSVKFSSPK